MATEHNMQTQERLAEAINSGELSNLEDIFSDEVVDHDPAPGQGPGPAGFRDFFTTLRSAFPDLKVAPEAVVADDDHVCLAYTIAGTHEGEFLGVAPTGREVSARGMQIARFEDGKIVERWGSSDELGILQQLDAAPVPA